jgi:hypothetical protein
LGRSIHTKKKNAEALPVTNKEIGLEVNAVKTKCVVMCRDQNAGQNHSMKIGNKCFVRLGQFKHLGATLTNQNCIPEEIKRRLKPGNA